MFYSQDILQKRGGKFGIIWIAATRARDLTRRDYSTVNVTKTCEQILIHFPENSRSVRGGFPRFSLYLTAQLMFGITLVHGKHAEYLYSDAMTLQSKFIPKRPGRRMVPGGTKDIDMRTPARPTEALRLEDPLDLYSPGLVELDPEFGRLNVSEDMIDPAFLPDIKIIHFPEDPPTPEWWPGRSRKSPSPLFPASPSEHDKTQVKDRKDISLPHDVLPELPFPVTDLDDDLLPPEKDDILFSPGEEGILPVDLPTHPPPDRTEGEEPATKKKKSEDKKRKERSEPREPEKEKESPADHSPIDRGEAPPVPEHSSSEDERRTRTRELELPPLNLDDILKTPPRRPTRPGRGLQIDTDTQMSREDVRDNLAHPEHTLAKLVLANPRPPPPTAEQLLNQPCIRLHHPALLRVWQSKIPATRFRNLQKTDSDTTTSPLSPEERDPDPEVPRDETFESESGGKRPRLNVSEESFPDVSRTSESGSERRPRESLPTKSGTTEPSILYDVPEEPGPIGPAPDIPEPGQPRSPEEPAVSPQREGHAEGHASDTADVSSKESPVNELCQPVEPGFSPRSPPVKSKLSRDVATRTIAERLDEDDSTTFETLASPEETDRATAARFLYFCLVFHKQQMVQLTQLMPYEDILIERGPRFTAMLSAAGLKH
ncbi:meiotic recombination protein REC8 homolog isoform X1 [Branchiostoma floridae x Branchiostoma japonicum]